MSEYYAPTLNSLYFALRQAVRDARCQRTTKANSACDQIAEEWGEHRASLAVIESEIRSANARLAEVRSSRDDDLVVAASIAVAVMVPIGRALRIVQAARAIVSVAEMGGSLLELAVAAAGLAEAAKALDRILEATRKIQDLQESLRDLSARLYEEDAAIAELRNRYLTECLPALRPTGFGPGSHIEDLIDDWIGG